MPLPDYLNKAVFISVLGHLAVFSTFSLSFGNKIQRPEYSPVYFWGQFLSQRQVSYVAKGKTLAAQPSGFGRKERVLNVNRLGRDTSSLSGYYVRPALPTVIKAQKSSYAENLLLEPAFLSKKIKSEAAIIFHPLLPYSFPLYFKDRQTAHVELMFKIGSSAKKTPIAIKRKISSGNLEVDLLTLRYISHYLFIQQASFTPNNWQTVKIDLSRER